MILTIYLLIGIALLFFWFMDYKKNTNNNFKKARKILDRKLNVEIENIEAGDDISKNILQVYKKKDLIPEYISNNIKVKNEEWNYNFFDDKESLKFLQDEYGEEFVKKYDSFIKREHKEDLFKLCWLYKNGGVFIDIDTEIILPLDEVIENVKNNFAIMHNDFRLNYYDDILSDDLKEKKRSKTLINSIIVTNKGNLKIKKCIENIMKIDQIDLTENYSLALFIMQHTLVDAENFQFFERSDNTLYPFVEGDMEIFDINDRKIGNSNYKNYKDGKFN